MGVVAPHVPPPQPSPASWKEQTLLNIVKLRYGDMPLFMQVASIVSGYTVEATVNLAGTAFEAGSAPSVSKWPRDVPREWWLAPLASQASTGSSAARPGGEKLLSKTIDPRAEAFL